MTRNTLRLDGVSYIGNVLDVLNIYLNLEVGSYTMPGGLLTSVSRAKIRGKEEKIFVLRSKRGDRYNFFGFPEGRDFDDFREKAPDILLRILNGEYNAKFGEWHRMEREIGEGERAGMQ